MSYRVGIDLGGTNIVAGVVDEKYEIIARASCKTNVPRPEAEICDSMAAIVKEAIKKAKLKMDDIDYIGIGVPGAVNPETRIIETSPNLFFKNWEIAKMMEERLHKYTKVENDANAAALWEYHDLCAGLDYGFAEADNIVFTRRNRKLAETEATALDKLGVRAEVLDSLPDRKSVV